MPDPNNQVHDFNPGIAASGLFWTASMPGSAFDADPGAGRARFHAESLAMGDYHDIFNAVTGGSAQPGHVTFDVRWDGSGATSKIRDTTFDFAGSFVAGDATIDFTVWDDAAPGVRYTSLRDGQHAVSAGVGHERNGVFFSQEGGADG